MREIDKQLHDAAWGNDYEAIKVLIRAGANLEAQDQPGETALHETAIHDHTEAMEALIRAGADLDAQDGFGRTALFIAVYRRNTATMEMLIQAGADLNAELSREWLNIPIGSTPRDVAAQEGDTHIVAMIDEALAARAIQEKSGPGKRHRSTL